LPASSLSELKTMSAYAVVFWQLFCLTACPMPRYRLNSLLACALAYLGRHAGFIQQPSLTSSYQALLFPKDKTAVCMRAIVTLRQFTSLLCSCC
jgi:hypothetical protein